MNDINPGAFRVNRFVMECGHISSGLRTEEDGTKFPVCIDCFRINPVSAKTVVDLRNRVAKCRYCGKIAKSDPDLFAYTYNKVGDEYYCGCRG